MIEEVKFVTETKAGTLIRVPATLEFKDGRIWFLKSPFALKDEIKAMAGSKWHGFEDPPKKVWSVTDCQRNRFQLEYLKGNNPYEWFDQDVVQREYERPLMAHQRELADHGLTYHFQIWAAEMGVGKTLSAFEVMEKSGVQNWFWVGPKSVLPAIRRESQKWNLQGVEVTYLTYDGLIRFIDDFNEGDTLPQGVIFDESSKLKNHGSQRSQAAQALADRIRQKFGLDGYVIAMSGTPSPKTPMDWWSQAEIVFPGFLKEGSVKALEHRLAFMVKEQFDSGPVPKRIGWKDDEHKCAICGQLETDLCHDLEFCEDPSEWHNFKASINEVALMHDRLQGLVIVKHKKDCLDLPDKRYRKVICKPNKSTLRVASALVNSCPNAVQGLTLLRELSDGFQYRETEAGMGKCPHCEGKKTVEEWFDPTDPEARYSAIDMLDPELVERLEKREVECPNCNGKGEVKLYTRTVREIPTPKEPALIDLLDENEEHGRIVIFAGFTGSVDRCVNICLKERWDVVRCDGRGFHVFRVESDGTVTQLVKQDALDYWANRDNVRVAFVAHPESGGMGLTLTEACMAVFWSNSFKPEFRVQAEDRIHRPGIDANLGATIVDLIHLPTDDRVLQVIQDNRRLELMSMGEVTSALEEAAADEPLKEAA